MKLIDILEKEMKMGRGFNYYKYRDLINLLLEDICNDEIIAYQVEEVQNNIVKIIRVITENSEQKDFKCVSYYDTIDRKYLNIRISHDENHTHKGLVINYSPLTVTATTSAGPLYKQYDFEYANNKVKITNHIEDKDLKNDNQIEANIKQIVNADDIEKIMNSINSTAFTLENNKKEKALIK